MTYSLNAVQNEFKLISNDCLWVEINETFGNNLNEVLERANNLF